MQKIIDKKVEEVMTKNVVSIKKDTTLKELKELWKSYDFDTFPVVENGYILGAVTKLDYLEIFSFDPERLIPDFKSVYAKNVEDIMSNDIIVAYPSDSLQKAVQKMLENRVRAILVTDESKKVLKGIITRGDIMKFLEVD